MIATDPDLFICLNPEYPSQESQPFSCRSGQMAAWLGRGFCVHFARTAQAGLISAVNMDTGCVNMLDEIARQKEQSACETLSRRHRWNG